MAPCVPKEILIIWIIIVAATITHKTSQNQLWVKLVAGTKKDTEIDHCTVCQRRGRDHTLERGNNVRGQICNCSIKQETETETEMWQRLRKQGEETDVRVNGTGGLWPKPKDSAPNFPTESQEWERRWMITGNPAAPLFFILYFDQWPTPCILIPTHHITTSTLWDEKLHM